ncbi:MAG: LysR substrate-binding domain-containing protein [Pseudomonadota bacterium]|nr:LysR substrate-binding domain-containing protein [Pseudomonadota bacterium]
MRRQAPPLEAIEAFIVATRAPSFRAAAEQLALSPSAFSRRIQTLESFVGAPLFERTGGAARLTRVGERYRDEVEPAVDTIRRATVDLRAERSGGTLRLVTPQSFAIGWLVQRLPAFMNSAGGAPIDLKIGRDATLLRKGVADMALIVATRDTNGLIVEPLIDLDAILVSAPVLADGSAPPKSLAELHRYARLSVYEPEGLWDIWLNNVGYDGPPLQPPKRHTSMFLAYEAAAAGMGLTLASPLLAERLLHDGRLRQCTPHRAKFGFSYNIVFADAAVQRRKEARAFATWLRETLHRSNATIYATL